MSYEHIRLILEHRDLSQFKGLKEDLWFEAKESTDYDLGTASGRYELAKDVSAFANSGGGYLVIGLKTQRLQEERTDQVTELDLIKQAEFDVTTYQGVIREYITPRSLAIEVGWVEDVAQAGEGVAYIHVPVQDDDQKYFLIAKVVEGNEKLREIVFGIVERIGSNNTPMTKERLHGLVRQGNSPTAERLNRIEEMLNGLMEKIGHMGETAAKEDVLEARLKNIE
jgi:predicted HTH transcriptional regulator